MHTLLIVEDEKMIRLGIKSMIQRSGVTVDNIIECNNGQMALEILKMQEIDVMFTDIRMPKMDGIELVKEMQKLPHVPLTVAISGYDDFSYAVEMMRMGAKDYILKPIDREKIREVLEKLNAEIIESKELLKQDRTLGYQQLKYFILNENITQQEKELLFKQYSNQFYNGKYVICCTNNIGKKNHNGDMYIYLSDVDDTELFITEVENLNLMVKTELLNRYIGVSSEHQGLESLQIAYKEALEARREAYFLGENLITYDEVHNKEHRMELDDLIMNQIIQLLGTDKYDEALRQLGRIFKNAKLGGYAPTNIEKHISILFEGIQSTYSNVLQVSNGELQQFQKIYEYNCFEEFEKEMMLWITEFCKNLNRQFDDYKNKQKIQQAVQYIMENYDKDLNMAVVSNHISMNYSLFSYVFKQYTGSNFVNFLKEIRIQESKRLLEETDMKIIDISQKIGYENEKHFMKTFKSVCGVSPTEYRKNMQFKRKEFLKS